MSRGIDPTWVLPISNHPVRGVLPRSGHPHRREHRSRDTIIQARLGEVHRDDLQREPASAVDRTSCEVGSERDAHLPPH